MINMATSIALVCLMLFIIFLLVFFMPDRARKLGISKISLGKNSIELDRENLEHGEKTKVKSEAVAGSDEQSDSQETIDHEHKPSPLLQMMEAAEQRDLERYKLAFDQHIVTVPDSERDFWTALHFVERQSIGDVEAADLLAKLGEEKPEWVWPIIYLAREAKNSSDYELAISRYDQAISRANSEHHHHAYIERIQLELEVSGHKAAIELSLKLFKEAGITLVKAYLAKELGQMFSASGDNASSEFFYNLSAQHADDNFDLIFDAAYAISQLQPKSISALHHYFQLRSKQPGHSYSVNNLAVWFSNNGNEKLYAYLLQEGAQFTPELSLSNLAGFLVERGLIDQAQVYLNSIDEPTRDKARFYRAKSDVENAKSGVLEELSQYQKIGYQNNTHYSETWESTLEYYSSGTAYLPKGEWISKDRNSRASIQVSDEITELGKKEVRLTITSKFLFNQDELFTGSLSTGIGRLFGDVTRQRKSQPTALTDYFNYQHSVILNPTASNKLRILAISEDNDRITSLEFEKAS